MLQEEAFVWGLDRVGKGPHMGDGELAWERVVGALHALGGKDRLQNSAGRALWPVCAQQASRWAWWAACYSSLKDKCPVGGLPWVRLFVELE